MQRECTFLTGGGAMAALIRSHDWAGTCVGPIESWPENLKTLVGVMVRSTLPMVVLWGPDGLMIYNDGYAEICGARHPGALGANVLDVWPEAADFNRNVLRQVLQGHSLTYREIELELYRHGHPESVWMNLNYAPVVDEQGTPAGVAAIVVETTERVLLQRRLVAERERFARLFQQAPTFMAMLRGPEHRIELANPGYFKLVGDRAIIGLTVAEALPEAKEQGYIDILDEVYRSGKAYSAVGSRFAVQGSAADRYLDFVYQPITGDDGETVGIFLEGVDVTAKVEAERRREALARLTERIAEAEKPADIGFAAAEILGSTLEVSRVGFGTIDPDTEMLHVARDWTADGVESLAGSLRLRDYGDFIDSLKRGEVIQIEDVREDPRTAGAAGALEAKHARSFVNIPILEQGRLVAVLYVNDAKVRAWEPENLALIREVAARTRTAVARAQATNALRERETQLRHANETLEERVKEALAERRLMADLVESTDTFIQAIDTDYRFLAINTANVNEYVRVYRIRPKVGDRLPDLLAGRPESREAVIAVWRRALAGEEFTEIAQFGDSEIEQRWYELKFRPIRDSDGTITGAYLFSTDVTERLREQQLLVEAEERLRQSQKMEAVGQLTGGIAHDFNNLLAGISGSLELIERRMSEGRLGGVERYIAAAQGASRRAAALTQRLLAFSRRQTLDPKPVDMNRMIGGMEDLIARSVGPSIEFRVAAAPDLWPVKVDVSQLENSLLNLCINARDAMLPEGGRLTVETANAMLAEGAARELGLRPGGYVSLAVTDTGCGMPPDIIDRVFDPFFTTKPIGVGTGLGLSMVHGFVRQSDGQIRVSSDVGKGTTIRLYLPRFEGASESAEQTAKQAIDPGGGETVLVVDDEATVRMLVTEVLQESGYVAMEAKDAPSALRIIQSDARIDLLITDVGLPGGLNGRQIADAARVTRPGLKVLFITGFAESAAIGSGTLEPGMAVLAKPFEIAALAGKIRDLIED